MSLDDTQVFLPEVWASHARFRHNKVAVICGDQQLTWGELNTRCNRTANAMLQAGYTTGSQVALLMSNSTATLVTLLAVMKAGACVVPISNHAYSRASGNAAAKFGRALRYHRYGQSSAGFGCRGSTRWPQLAIAAG